MGSLKIFQSPLIIIYTSYYILEFSIDAPKRINQITVHILHIQEIKIQIVDIIYITNEDYNIIQHTRKSLLFNNCEPWIKKDSSIFDVTMGAFDGTEVCEM